MLSRTMLFLCIPFQSKYPHPSLAALDAVYYCRLKLSRPSSVTQGLDGYHSISWLQKSLSHVLLYELERIYGTLEGFFRSHPKHFLLHGHLVKKAPFPRGLHLDGEVFEKVFPSLIPPRGYVPMRHLSSYFFDAPTTTIEGIINESAQLRQHYAVVGDRVPSENLCLVTKEFWAFTQEGRYINIGDNHSLAIYQLVTDALIMLIPNHWVPLLDVAARLSIPMQELYADRKSFLHSCFSFFRTDVVERALYGSKDTVFVRRLPGATTLPPCTARYPEFELPPDQVLRLAFSMPPHHALAHPKNIIESLFPTVRKWVVHETVFTLNALCSMYQDVFRQEGGLCGSYLREKNGALDLKATNTALAEEHFEALLAAPQNATMRDTLLALVAQPTHMFRPYRVTKYTAPSRLMKSSNGHILPFDKDTPVKSDEMLVMVAHNALPELEQVRQDSLLNTIQQSLSKDDFVSFSASVRLRYGTFDKFLRQFPEKFVVEEVKQPWGFLQLVTKADGHNAAIVSEKANPYLITERLLQSVAETFQSNPRKNKFLDEVEGRLPQQARLAAKQLGGLRSLLEARPDLFLLQKLPNMPSIRVSLQKEYAYFEKLS